MIFLEYLNFQIRLQENYFFCHRFDNFLGFLNFNIRLLQENYFLDIESMIFLDF